MANFMIRKFLRGIGLLDRARALKRRMTGNYARNAFNPADPRLCISTWKCLEWLHARHLLDGSDYLEFGIYRGFNLWYTQGLARAMGAKDMRFFGFDSFFGIPPVDGVDKDGPFHEGDFSAYREEVEYHLGRFGVDWKQTILVEGFFDKTLTPELMQKHQFRRTAFCVVDCDLYSSAKTVLDYVVPLLQEQTILFFDDWDDFGDHADKGEPKAFAELCEAQKSVMTFEPFEDLARIGGKGKAFVVHRK